MRRHYIIPYIQYDDDKWKNSTFLYNFAFTNKNDVLIFDVDVYMKSEYQMVLQAVC